MRFKTIIRNINVLNILLISVIIISISYSLLPLLDIKVKDTLPAAKKTVEDTKEKAAQTQTPSIAEYTMIAEENLFHPERKIPVEKKEEQPLPKPDFVLYGTLITDDISLAYLEDLKAPQSTPGRGKRQTALRKGDAMSGYVLKEVEAEKIVMVRGEDKMIVALNDLSRPKDRKETGVTTTASVQPVSQPAGVASARIVSSSSDNKTRRGRQEKSDSKDSKKGGERSKNTRPAETVVSTPPSVSSTTSSTSSRQHGTGTFGRSLLIGK